MKVTLGIVQETIIGSGFCKAFNNSVLRLDMSKESHPVVHADNIEPADRAAGGVSALISQ